MRIRILMLLMLLSVATAAPAQVNIGINISVFPELVRVPEYPVYYAPRQQANYFFYDGLYWVFQDDEWYSSDWYNGPWWRVAPEYVPVYVLRIPVRYYRRPPPYFAGWRRDAPPQWGEHWGREWEQRRTGWNRWNRGAAPAPAPLPTYQRNYAGNRYPRVEQQQVINNRNYNYRPKDVLVREHVRPQIEAVRTRAAPPEQAQPSRNDARQNGRERDARGSPDRSNREREAKDARERAQRPVPTVAPAPAPRSEPPAPARAQPAPNREAQPPRRDAGNERNRDTTPRASSQPVPTQQPPQQPQAAREQPRPSQRPEHGEPGKGGERGGQQGRGNAESEKGAERSHDKGGERK